MPCLEESPRDVDVALQILDAVTPRIDVNGEMDSAVVREITQTDHLNKHLLKTFLKRLNVMSEVSTIINHEDDNPQEFED